MGELASVFRTVYFNTDDYVLRGEEYQQVVENVAKYLKAHPDTYVYVQETAMRELPKPITSPSAPDAPTTSAPFS